MLQQKVIAVGRCGPDCRHDEMAKVGMQHAAGSDDSMRHPTRIVHFVGVYVQRQFTEIKQKQAMANNTPDTSPKLSVVPHHEVAETFADHIGFMVCDGSTLRIDFEVIRMNEPASSGPPLKQRHVVSRLALPMNCAIDLLNQMGKLGGQLAQSGLIKTVEGQIVQQTKTN
jgi:hypothetical protein